MSKENLPTKASAMDKFKNRTAKDLKEVQGNMQKIFEKNDDKIAKEYEEILQENIGKLREIAQNDFETFNTQNKQLVQETKVKIHNLIQSTFQHRKDSQEFAQAAQQILQNINTKLKNDIKGTDRRQSTRSSTRIFIHSYHKPQEQIEAEKSLENLFAEQLLEFNRQIIEDFEEINDRVKKNVGEAKDGVINKIHKIANVDLSTDDEHISQVQNNVNNVLKNIEEVFKAKNEQMHQDIDQRKQQLNNSARYLTDKLADLKDVFIRTDDDDD